MDRPSRVGLMFSHASDTCLMDRMQEETLKRT